MRHRRCPSAPRRHVPPSPVVGPAASHCHLPTPSSSAAAAAPPPSAEAVVHRLLRMGAPRRLPLEPVRSSLIFHLHGPAATGAPLIHAETSAAVHETTLAPSSPLPRLKHKPEPVAPSSSRGGHHHPAPPWPQPPLSALRTPCVSTQPRERAGGFGPPFRLARYGRGPCLALCGALCKWASCPCASRPPPRIGP
jgi:hypothetical protein